MILIYRQEHGYLTSDLLRGTILSAGIRHLSDIEWLSAETEHDLSEALFLTNCSSGVVTTFERAVALIYSRTCEPRRPWIHITRDAVLVAQAREAGVEVYST